MIAKDDYIIVLDFLPHGKPNDRKAEPIAQGIGEKFLNLLEVVIKEGVNVKANDRIYVGDEKREEVKYIRGRIGYEELTNYAKNMVVEIVTSIVDKDEKRFVNFFNKAGPVTTRLHSLELLPGIGKKHMWDIISERRKKLFESFKEIQERVPMLPDTKKMVIKRVIEDLEGKDRYKLFVGAILE
jgi:putative nucleotide binding protein